MQPSLGVGAAVRYSAVLVCRKRGVAEELIETSWALPHFKGRSGNTLEDVETLSHLL